MSAPPRKLRRGRDSTGAPAAAAAAATTSGYALYERQGNAASAYKALYSSNDQSSSSSSSSSNSSLAHQYNQWILTSLTTSRSDQNKSNVNVNNNNKSPLLDLQQQLEQFESRDSTKQKLQQLTARKRQRNQWIMAYNRALLLYTQHECTAAQTICATWLSSHLLLSDDTSNKNNKKKKKPWPYETAHVAARLAFLWLEVRLATSTSIADTTTTNSEEGPHLISNEALLSWLEQVLAQQEEQAANPSNSNLSQFKFLLSLYKGRVDLAARTPHRVHEEARIRSARKELKMAMEVYQHKLRPKVELFTADNASTVSSVDDSTSAPTTTAATAETVSWMPVPPQPSVVLQKLHQSALNVKAHLEQLKGNVKKSLILCQEAQFNTTTTSDNNNNNMSEDEKMDDYYNDKIHANNLAVVYQTTHKKHLAWHVYTKILSSSSLSSTMAVASRLAPDGTAEPVPTWYTWHNAALCALQARHYQASYECWTHVVRERPQASPLWPNATTWVRLAEACLGLHHEQPARDFGQDVYQTTPIQVHGEPKGLVLTQPSFNLVDGETGPDNVLPPVGSSEDLELVARYPLRRARSILEHVLDHDEGTDACMDHATRQSARLALAYVSLLARNYERALELTQAVTENEPSDSSTASTMGERARLRRLATARMYAAEATCCLGRTPQAMNYLVSGNSGPSSSFSDSKSVSTSSALDSLASDLGGVTIETAAVSAAGKRRLARAQTLVRSSASIVTAAVGHNMTAAKQLAMSAQAMEDASSVLPSSNGAGGSNGFIQPSASRRALLYCLLRGGNTSAALSLLQSMRNRG